MSALLERISPLLRDLPELLGGHLLLSVCALSIGAAVSLPLGIASARSARCSSVVLTLAGVVQTVPSLALLALMVPLLGGLIGFVPAFVALVLYSALPMLRNTVTGVNGIDPALIEAARGLGMTDRQILARVRLPLATPVIVAGVRTATVWVVGMTTLATAVGAQGLGTYIFMGLQTRNHVATAFGCVFAALLAIGLDQLIRLLERGLAERRRRLVLVAVSTLAVLLLPALTMSALSVIRGSALRDAGTVLSFRDSLDRNAANALAGVRIVTGSKPFTESYVLAKLLELQLEAAGADVDKRPSMGSSILFDALAEGSVDCYVDYSGTIWANVMKREDAASRLDVQIDVAKYLRDQHGVLCVGRLGFENAYCLVMHRERADELGVRSIADLSRHARDLKVGGDPEVFGRPEWRRVAEEYELSEVTTVGMQAVFLYGALLQGQVDLITAYSTDGRIDAHELRILDDPLEVFPPYDALLLVSESASRNRRLIETLLPLVNSIDDDTMRRANRRVEVDGESPEEVARELWGGGITTR